MTSNLGISKSKTPLYKKGLTIMYSQIPQGINTQLAWLSMMPLLLHAGGNGHVQIYSRPFCILNFVNYTGQITIQNGLQPTRHTLL